MPWPRGLVVKNGSKALAITSGGMPVPVSETQSERYCPSGMSCCRAPCRSIQRLAVSIVIRPPSGIASRALMQRLSRAFSSCEGSTSADQRPLMQAVSTCTPGPTVRWIRSSMPLTSVFTLVALGASVCRREKASRRCVRAAARLVAPWAATMYLSTSLRRPCVMRAFISSRLPEMPANRLLKSCARPPVSWPTASIFWDWRSCSSASISSAVRASTRCSSVSLRDRKAAAARSRSASTARRSSTSMRTPGKLSGVPSGAWSTRPFASIQ
ncbi:hypothetical protein AEGHOMDF_4546 [Methylobacterium soli]|nr:hypothetical protein AEGHOMDF_4546 [Methylobacterium soli]